MVIRNGTPLEYDLFSQFKYIHISNHVFPRHDHAEESQANPCLRCQSFARYLNYKLVLLPRLACTLGPSKDVVFGCCCSNQPEGP